jgi:pyruvate kinase
LPKLKSLKHSPTFGYIVESDGIMIARGDLGVELPVEQIPLIQRNIIRKCLHRANR